MVGNHQPSIKEWIFTRWWFQTFLSSPLFIWGRFPFLTDIFKKGWNHQIEKQLMFKSNSEFFSFSWVGFGFQGPGGSVPTPLVGPAFHSTSQVTMNSNPDVSKGSTGFEDTNSSKSMPKMEKNIFQFRAIISGCGIFGDPYSASSWYGNTINVIISARGWTKILTSSQTKKTRKDLYKYIIFLLNIHVFVCVLRLKNNSMDLHMFRNQLHVYFTSRHQHQWDVTRGSSSPRRASWRWRLFALRTLIAIGSIVGPRRGDLGHGWCRWVEMDGWKKGCFVVGS